MDYKIWRFEDLTNLKIGPEFYRNWGIWRFEDLRDLKILPQAPACPDLYREGCEISIVCVAERWLQTVTLCCSTDCNQRPATNGR